MLTKLIVFAKQPTPGFAKTRLIPRLGDIQAADLAEKLLLHTCHLANNSNFHQVELSVTPNSKDIYWKRYKQFFQFPITQQVEGDLGEKLKYAIGNALLESDAVIVVGTDCPFLTSEHLDNAINELRYKDTVLIPAVDGGYVLIGLRKFHPSLFEYISWSTDKVYQETKSRLNQLNWCCWEGEALIDIDSPDDLIHLNDIKLHTSFIEDWL